MNFQPSKKLLSLLCAMLMAVTGCGTSTPTVAMETLPAIRVVTETPTYASLEQRATFSGCISPDESVMVIGKVGGTVQQTFFEVGDAVKKGQLLFSIDPVDIQLMVDQAKISYDTALKSVEIAQSGSGDALTELKYKSDIDMAQAAYETARNLLELEYEDEIDMSRFKKLWKEVKATERTYDKNPTSENYTKYKEAYREYINFMPGYREYQTAIVEFENAYTTYENALESYDIYKKQQTGENKDNFELQRKAAENGYQQALKQLEYTQVVAPISGIIEEKNISAHDTYDSSPAYVISNKSVINVEFSVSSPVARAMSIGDAVIVESENTLYDAEVVQIGNVASPTSGLFTVKAQLEDGSNLFTGLLVKLTAITAKANNVLTIPILSAHYENGNPYVYIVSDGVAVRTPVTLGISNNDRVEVVAGLSAEDQLIVNWNPNLNDGSPVEVLDLAAQDSASTPAA